MFQISIREKGAKTSKLRLLRRIKKFIFTSHPKRDIENFRKKLEELQSLEHPNVMQLLDVREDMYSFFLVFEAS